MNIFIPIGIVFLILIQIFTNKKDNEFDDLLSKNEYDDYVDIPEGIPGIDDLKELNEFEVALNKENNINKEIIQIN